MRALTLLGVLAALSLPSAARAGTPVMVGAGTDAVVAVDTGGTAHVAWSIQAAPFGVGYCKLPRGASACAVTKAMPFGGDSQGIDLNVFARTPNDIEIYGTLRRCAGNDTSPEDRTFRFASTDGGASFGARQCKNAPVATNLNSALATNGESLLNSRGEFLGARGNLFLALPAGSATSSTKGITIFPDGGASVIEVALGQTGAGAQARLVAVKTRGGGGVDSVVFAAGADAPLADLNTAAKWSAPTRAPSSQDTIVPPTVASGPSGLVAVTDATFTPFPGAAFLVHRFDTATNTFGNPFVLNGMPGTDGQIDAYAATQDAAGTVHIAWSAFDRAAFRTTMRYARSTDGGRSFTIVGTLADIDRGDDVDVAAAPDGRGVAVYNANVNGTDRPVFAVPLEVTPPASTPPPPPSPSPSPSPSPAPSPAPVTVTPKPSPTTRRVTATAGGARLTLTTPRACVARGKAFTAAVTAARLAKGNAFVKLTRVDFLVGRKVVVRDRKAPFRRALKVPATAKRCTKLRVRVIVTVDVKRGRSPKKVVASSIAVCG